MTGMPRTFDPRLLRFILVPLVLVLAWLPPEAYGEAMAGTATLIGLLYCVTRLPTPGGTGPILLLAAACFSVVLAWSAPVPSAAIEPITLMLMALGLVVAVTGLRSPETIGRTVVATLALSGAVVGVHGVYQRLFGLKKLAAAVAANPDLPDHVALLNRIEEGRAFSSFSTPAGLAGYLILVLPVTAGAALAYRDRRRWWLGAAAVAQLLGLLAAASAIASGALLVALVLGLLSGRMRSRAVWVGLIAVAVLLAVVVLSRDRNLLALDDPTSPWRLRGGNLRSAYAMSLDHPFKGVGPGGFSEHYPAYRRAGDNEVRHVHNLPLELTAETGCVLGPMMTALLVVVFLGPMRRRGSVPAWARGVAVGLAAFALHNLGDYTAYMASVGLTAGLLVGLEWRLATPDGKTQVGGPWPARAGALLLILVAAIAARDGLSQNRQLLAREAAFAGDWPLSRRLADGAYRLSPWSTDAALLRARTNLGGIPPGEASPEKRAVALEQAERCVQLSSVRPAAREVRATARIMNGDLPGAHADLAEAARLYPLEPRFAAERDRIGTALERFRPERDRP